MVQEQKELRCRANQIEKRLNERLSVELSGCWLRLSTHPKSHGRLTHSNEKMPVDIGVL
jgi:hypothetical protein